ncbi:alpha-amylase family glycosyl hydrolase [Metabacillus litoralis]|uniref:alpha-amylase family glycosyl hydrolase n=1 Tax=Metabacillus litoralis TaxID=152268 RepID=UPI002041A1A3|nr:alpha-amylase family glycosyl hydrolase [Metabacillus litoralis]MCM3160944.1 alpha-amylase family glycosyl hydrolase [Metabacillus litoralis]
MRRQALKLFLIPFLLFYAFPVSAAEKEEKAWQEEIAYYVVVDRFNNADPNNDGDDLNFEDPAAYHGGDIEGILKKIDYLHDMGFTTLILSPVFKENENSEVKQIDEHAGTVEDVKKLVDEAHKLNMKIMLDYGQKNEDMISTATSWMQETGIDGYYIKQADEVNQEVWQEFHQKLKEINEEYYLVGTVKEHNSDVISTYMESGFDSLLNIPFYEAATQAFANVDQSLKPVTEVTEQSSPLLSTYVDSDETVRFTRHAIQNNQHPGVRLKMAFAYMYSTPGTPIVYYGSEIAVDGGEPPTNRPLMNFQSDEELIDYLEKLAIVRKTLPSLTKGDYELLYEKDGMIIFKRMYEEETVVVAINNSTESQKVKISDEQIAEDKKLQGLLTGDTFEEENNEYEFIIDREIAEIYEIKEKTGLNIPFISVFIIVPTLFIIFLVLAKKRGKKK